MTVDTGSLTLYNFAPLAKMSLQCFQRLPLVWAFRHLGNIQGSVGTVECTDTTHIISILRMLLPPETVARVIKHIVCNQWSSHSQSSGTYGWGRGGDGGSCTRVCLSGAESVLAEYRNSPVWAASTSKEQANSFVSRSIRSGVTCVASQDAP